MWSAPAVPSADLLTLEPEVMRPRIVRAEPEAAPRSRKTIAPPADLALHGAPPAYDEPLHVGRPNIGDRERFLAYTNDLLDRSWLSNNGPLVQELECKTADYLGVRHVIAMCNGTIALEIAIRALGLKGEVILPSYTFVATAQVLLWQEITPVFADIDPHTHSIDPKAVERMITPRTSGATSSTSSSRWIRASGRRATRSWRPCTPRASSPASTSGRAATTCSPFATCTHTLACCCRTPRPSPSASSCFPPARPCRPTPPM